MVRVSSRPLAIASDCVWSVMAMNSSPRAFAAATMVSSDSRPSDSVVCMCTSPLRSDASISRGSAFSSAASISPRFSRSSGGT